MRFLLRDAPWDEGAVVDMSQESAEKLVENGVAELVEDEPWMLPDDSGAE